MAQNKTATDSDKPSQGAEINLFQPDQYLVQLATQLTYNTEDEVQLVLFESINQLHNEIVTTNDYNMLHYSARKMVQSMANLSVPDDHYDMSSPTNGPKALLQRYMDIFSKEKNLFKSNNKSGKKTATRNDKHLLEVKLDSFVVLVTIILRGTSNFETIQLKYGRILTIYIATLISDILQTQSQLNYNQIIDNHNIKETATLVSRLQVIHRFSRIFDHFVDLYTLSEDLVDRIFRGYSKSDNVITNNFAMQSLKEKLSKLLPLVMQTLESILTTIQSYKSSKDIHVYICAVEELCLIWATEIFDKLGTQYNSGISYSQVPFVYNLAYVIAKQTTLYTFQSEANHKLGIEFAENLVQKSDWKDPILSYSILLNVFLSNLQHIKMGALDEIKHGRQIFAHLPDLPQHSSSHISNMIVHPNMAHEDLIHSFKIRLMESPPPITFVSDSFVAIISWLIGPPPNTACRYLDKSAHDLFSSLKHVHDSTSRNDSLKAGQLNSNRLGQNLNYLIFYSCWESIRYCFLNKMKTPYGTVRDFLSYMKSALDERYCSRSTVTNGESIGYACEEQFAYNLEQKMLLVIFDIFEKLLNHSIDHSAGDLFQMDEAMRSFYLSNERSLNNLMSHNRSKLSRMALEAKSYADAWRHACLSLYRLKIESKPSKNDCSSSDDGEGDEPEDSLQDLYLAARGLGDIDLLCGIDIFVSEHFPGSIPHLKLEISNLETRYEDTLKLADEFISGIFSGDYVDFKPTVQDSILKLASDACISLGKLQEAHKYIEKIKNIDDKLVYNKLLKLLSLSSSSIHRETFAHTNYDVVKKWLSRWDDGNDNYNSDSIMPEHSCPFNLNQYLLASIARTSHGFEIDSNRTLLKDVSIELNRISTLQALFYPSHYDNELKVSYLVMDLVDNHNIANPSKLENLIERKMDNPSLTLLYNYLCYYYNIQKLSEGPKYRNFLKKLNFSINSFRLKLIKLHRRQGNTESWSRLIDEGLFELDQCYRHNNKLTYSDDIFVIRDEMDLLRTRYSYEKILTSQEPKYSGLVELLRTLHSNEIPPTHPALSLRAKDMLVKVIIAIEKDLSNSSEFEMTKRFDHMKTIQKIVSQQEDDGITDGTSSLFEKTLALAPILQSTKVKILESLSSWAHAQRKQPNPSRNFLELAFDTDLKLLKALESCNNEGKLKKLTSTHCALRILSMIPERGLTKHNIESFQDDAFIRETINIWVKLAGQLLSITMKKNTNDKQEFWHAGLFNLLKRICSYSPQTLIYPVIVGHLDLVESLQGLAEQTSTDYKDPKSSSELLSVDYLRQTVLKRWLELKQILQKASTSMRTLSDNVEIVGETEKFIKELRRITSLWGEHLFNVSGRIMQRIQYLLRFLQDLKCPSDASKSISDEKQKKTAIDKWQSLIDYSLSLMKTIMAFIERQAQQNVSSRYEMWFRDTFSITLFRIMAKLNQIKTSLTTNEPYINFDPFSESNLSLLINIGSQFNVCRQVVHEYNRVNRNKLYMEVISPTLSRLDSSGVLMPDCSSSTALSTEQPLFISKVKQVIRILISKTCPKKLTLLGSDGKYRSFILKGHEDLRLDRHIMQLFALINQILSKNKPTRYQYSLRHYAVTPLSTRSGLIQWIDAPSIYSFYRTWLAGSTVKQRLEYQQKQQKLSKQVSLGECVNPIGHRASTISNTAADMLPPPAQPLRPHEIFYAKLTALGNHGVAKILSINYLNVDRKKWNTQLLVKVLVELEKETPDNLIANHLWFKSVNAHEQWTKTQTFIHSCSVMSMVGYLIGLGDRHMDNILLDSTSGELVHIDYNMSFDLARTWLRIPEQVPFRLTQNFVRAFGFSGLEGGFTRSCQRVLNILKDNKETLLHLLNPLYWEFIVEFEENNVKSSQKPADPSTVADDSSTVAPAIQKERVEHAEEILGTEISEKDVSLSNIAEHQNKKILDTILENNKLASQNVDYQDGFDLSQTLNMQRCIKTPTRLTKVQALDKFASIESKLDGTDELVRSYHYQQKTRGQKVGPSPLDAPDLIGLTDSHTTEEQVEALIHAATSSVNKARMYEGWTPWV